MLPEGAVVISEVITESGLQLSKTMEKINRYTENLTNFDFLRNLRDKKLLFLYFILFILLNLCGFLIPVLRMRYGDTPEAGFFILGVYVVCFVFSGV